MADRTGNRVKCTPKFQLTKHETQGQGIRNREGIRKEYLKERIIDAPKKQKTTNKSPGGWWRGGGSGEGMEGQASVVVLENEEDQRARAMQAEQGSRVEMA